ncbi:MAG: HDIG domain-containing protein [Marinifilaceae bacterium]|nr:HDIG domain-containing protein [Marinifilaceae bacterium]
MIDTLAIIKKYYTPGSLAYTSLVTHCKLVAQKAVYFARKHPELALDITFVEEAAMLHDIGIFLTNAPDIGCHGDKPYICHGYLGADLMRQEGLPKHALVCERHTGTGFTRERIEQQGLPLPHRDMFPVTLEEKLITFADTFYSKSNLTQEKTPAQIRESLSRFGNEPVQHFEEWSRLFS